MGFWLNQCFFVSIVLFIFSACGLGLSSVCFSAEKDRFPYWMFTAPMFGSITLMLPLIVFYDIGLNFRYALIASMLLMMLFTLINFRKIDVLKNKNLMIKFVLVLVLSAFVANLVANFSAIHSGGPYVMFHDGTDALGYANNADWLQYHFAKEKPILSAAFPFSALPSINLAGDHRLGSYFYLAAIANLAKLPALFSYYLAVTIYLACAVLGLAACVARTRGFFIFTSLALLTTGWFQLSFLAFLGKFLVCPAIFVFLILTLRGSFQKFDSERFFVLILLSLSITSLYPYMMPMAVLLSVMCALIIYYLLEGRYIENFSENYQLLLFLVALLCLFFAVSGGFADMWKQQVFGNTFSLSMNFKPWELAFKLFTIKYFASDTMYGSFKSYMDCTILIFAIALQVALCFVAFFVRARAAFILLVAPSLMILLTYYVLHSDWSTFQLVAMPYFCLILGAVLLLEEITQPRLRKVTVFLLALSVIVRVPYIISVIHRDIVAPPSWSVYSQSEYTEIKNIVGSKAVLVDANGIFDAQPLFLEFERDGHAAAFTQRAWDLTNWGLPVPQYVMDDISLSIISKADPIPQNWKLLQETKHYKILQKLSEPQA